MARMHHGGLPMAALNGRSPLPYTFDTSNLNLLPKIWSKSVDHSPDLVEDALKRLITIAPPSITTTHHDSGLPPPLSYTLANNDPPLEKFEGQAPIPKHWMDKMGGCAAHRQFGSNTKDGEDGVEVLEGGGKMI